MVDTLLHRKSPVLSSYVSKQSLADDFAKYFESKIDNIRSGIGSRGEINPDIDDGCPASLSAFTLLSDNEVSKLVVSLSSATCYNDPIPTFLGKDCLNMMLPTITRIINLSLEWDKFPLALKSARISPLLKKSTLDPDQLKSYRPMSRLPFLSKITVKALALRLNSYMYDNDLNGKYQSAYKQFHSTETALVCFADDIRLCVDEKKAVF